MVLLIRRGLACAGIIGVFAACGGSGEAAAAGDGVPKLKVPGDTGAPVYRTKAGAIGVAICYDRHYPEYMRALALGGAELVVVPQAGAIDEWPEGLYEGEMRVAAFQHGYFVALCNRVGVEDCLTFGGESFVCAPDGRVLARAPKLEDALLVVDLDLSDAAASHARRLFLQHRRPELYADWLRIAR